MNSFKDWTSQMVDSHNRKVARAGSNAPVFPPPKRKPAYTADAVRNWCAMFGLPEPEFELKFHPERKWRFDIVFRKNNAMVAIEVQGGIWIRGGHSRGAAQSRDWEKLHEAQILGWKVFYCEPKKLLTVETAETVKRLLGERDVLGQMQGALL